MGQGRFIKEISEYICKYAPQYDIQSNSAVIAQAILESGWGESKLAKEYHNYFGLKCGTLWQGKSVNMQTNEEYEPGTITTIRDNFRVYDNMEDGVKGYFEFIQLPRYQNLRGVKDARTYLELISVDGYATSSSYVKNCMDIINQHGLKNFDNEYVSDNYKDVNIITSKDVIDLAKSLVGINMFDGSHHKIIDGYNSQKVLPVNYKVTYSDDWCDTFLSYLFIALNAVDLIGGTECGVERHIQIFKNAGIWEEDGNVIPKPGWIICYNWDDSTQPNDGWADHIGIIIDVKDNVIITIEGNVGKKVSECYIPVGYGYIRGFAKPKYPDADKNTIQSVDVSDQNIEQKKNGQTLNKEPKWVGEVTANVLNVRTWAGTENPNIISWPILKFGNRVDVCDTLYAKDGSKWYYIRIAGRIFGFVSAKYIHKL